MTEEGKYFDPSRAVDKPTAKEKLLAALREADAPQSMIDYAQSGGYADFESQSATPIMDLVRDARNRGLDDIAKRAMDGEFDAE